VAEATEEKWCDADVHRIAGEIALMSPEPDVAKAQQYFERALAVARQQQAKSWELRAAMSMARLARAGQTATGPRPSRSGLRLVHRGSRYARLEAGQDGARRTGALTNGALLFDHTLRSGHLRASTKRRLSKIQQRTALRPNKDDGRRAAGHHPTVRRWSRRYMTQWQ
jgi:hypothetical protein